MPDVILFGFPHSSFVPVAQLVLTHKEVAYTFHDLEPDMGSPKHLALHPFDRVPILQHGDFTLYEDEGDNYDYEHGAYSLIPLHWDDKKEELTIGTRVGVFPGMLGHRIFRVMRVNDGHGVGMDLASKPDATVQYEGKTILIQLPKSAQRSTEP